MNDLYRGFDSDPGWVNRRLADLERQIAEQAAARRLVIATTHVQADINSMTLTSAYAEYLVSPVTAPPGYSFAIVNMFVSAGVTISGTVDTANNGSVGVAPVVNSLSGQALSNGRTGGGPVSVNAGLAYKAPVVNGKVTLSVLASANVTGQVAGSGNVHLTATLIFTRAT